jgi:hypothetical protein
MKTTFLAALVAAALALPSFGQSNLAPTAKLEASPDKVQAKEQKPKADAKATPKEGAKLAKAQGKKGKKTAKPKREAKAAG